MTKKMVPGFAWALVWLMVLATTPVAGGPDAVGSLVGNRNATLDGYAPLPSRQGMSSRMALKTIHK